MDLKNDRLLQMSAYNYSTLDDKWMNWLATIQPTNFVRTVYDIMKFLHEVDGLRY